MTERPPQNSQTSEIQTNDIQVESKKYPGIGSVLREEGLNYLRTFSDGNSGSIVMHTMTNNGTELVVKTPADDRSQEEIDMNIVGYQAMQEEGLGDLLPPHYRTGNIGDTRYLVTSYLGKSFHERCDETEYALDMYGELISKLDEVYTYTVQPDHASEDFFRNTTDTLLRNYNEYLLPRKLLSKKDIKKVQKFTPPRAERSCFAVFDFTPEDVYLTDGRIVYPDPKDTVRGNPIVDIACFAGVSRDVYHMKGAEEGYELLHDFAVTDVADILDLERQDAERIFEYGRALQYSLSARFRIESDPELAKTYARESIAHLKNALV